MSLKRPITDLQSDDDDSDVDVDDEFSDDDDELEDEPASRSKKKKTNVNKFILDEAEVDDDAEDDDDDDLEEGFEQLINKDEDEEEGTSESFRHQRRLDHLLQMQEEDKLEEYYRKKYAEADAEEAIDTSNYAKNEEVKQQSALPGVKDPRLWQVKCRMGEEKQTAIKLLRKYINLEVNNDPLQIKSVVVPVGVRGCIYIEAFKQSHVKAALAGVNALGMGKWQQPMVPINEMADVLKVVSEPMAIKTHSWVRIKRGVYRDDLAQIDYVEHNQNKVVCKMLPRVDYKKVKSMYKDREPVQSRSGRSAKGRPAQKLFDADLVRSLGGELKKDGDFIIFESGRYRNGFLFKTLAFTGITIDGPKPTLEELEKFDELPENVDPDLLPTDKKLNSDSIFSAGDIVEVCEGELIHMTGTIISISGDKVTIVPNHADLKNAGALDFPSRELRKIFKDGDHVRVIHGKYEGETGLVVRVDDNVAVIVADTTYSEMKVRPRDMQLCTEMNSGVDSQGMYQIGDVVEVDQTTIGYIVRIERESVRILTQHGKTQSVRNNAIARKLRCGQALDSQQNFVRSKNIVNVLDSGSQGEIKHIWRHFLFLFNRCHGENGGIFVVKARNTILAGAQKLPSDLAGASPRLASPSRSPMRSPMRTPSHGARQGGRDKRDREFIGKTVRVKQGAYKGYVGIVRDSTDTTARIELHTDCKVISVEKGHLIEVTTATGGFTTPSTPYITKTPAYGGVGSATPMYGSHSGSRTPMYGSGGGQTPTRGSGDRTPYYGAQTPTHDGGNTPRAGGFSAWDPNYPNTPARSDEYTDFYDNSPSPAPFSPANPQTPGYGEPMTPGYAMDSLGNPATPGTSSDYNPSSPSVPSPASPASPYTEPSPSPGASSLGPPSPGSEQSVPSPYSTSSGAPSPMTPQTANENWPLSGIEVVMLDSFEDGQYIGQPGYIRAVSGMISTVWLYEEEREFECQSYQMKPVVPKKQDKVVIITGNRRGNYGQLINIDNDDGIVKADKSLELRILKLDSLAKLSTHHN